MKYLAFVLLITVNIYSAVTTDSLKAKGSAINVKDSANFNAGTYATRLSTPSAGITRANIDSSDHRIITSDSATIPVFKGVETHRDSAYFASGLRGLRLYTPQAAIDSLVGDVKVGGSLIVSYQSGSVSTPDYVSTGMSYYNGIDKSKCKYYLYNSGSNYYGIGIGSDGNIIYHVDDLSGSHNFAFNNSIRTTIDSTGIKLKSYGAYGQVKIAPINDGSESGIGFFRDTNYTTTNSWVIGQGLAGGPNTGNFIFWTEVGAGGNTKATIDTNGNITAAGNATISGSVTAATCSTGTLQLSGGDLLSVYDTGSFACTVSTSYLTVEQTGLAKYTVVGNLVTISLPVLTGTSNSAEYSINTGISSSLQPTDTVRTTCTATNNTSETVVCRVVMYPNDKNIYLLTTHPYNGTFTSSGTKGVRRGTTIHYTR